MISALAHSPLKHARATAGLAMLATAIALAVTATADASSAPVGPLPRGPVSTITTSPGQLVAIALPSAAKSSGLVWRIARRYNASVVREVSEADVGANVVVIYKVAGKGTTSVVFALTRGDTSSKAVKASTYKIASR
jgi:hypothetical protein